MKKIISLLLVAVFMLSVFSGCKKDAKPADTDKPAEKAVIRIGGLKGPTSMGLVKLMDDYEKGNAENSYSFKMATTGDELTPEFIKGELDIISVPVNMGAVLYNKTKGNVKIAAVNTLGVLYIVTEDESIKSLKDLKGKTLYATGKGTTPEYALSYLLSKSGMTLGKDVKVEWKSEPTEITAILSNEKNAVAMLPEPFVTVACSKVKGLKSVISLTDEWEKLGAEGSFITAGLIVRKDFIENHSEEFKTFLNEYSKSVDYINGNTAEGGRLVEKYGIVKSQIAEKAIPKCNITFITGEEMKTAVKGYLSVLNGQNPSAVGGKLPDEDFYYDD